MCASETFKFPSAIAEGLFFGSLVCLSARGLSTHIRILFNLPDHCLSDGKVEFVFQLPALQKNKTMSRSMEAQTGTQFANDLRCGKRHFAPLSTVCAKALYRGAFHFLGGTDIGTVGLVRETHFST